MPNPDLYRPGEVWPSAAYLRQVETLRSAVGRTVYLVEVAATPIHLGIRQTGQPFLLLEVLEFPRPDPARGLAPHMIVLDDGRGINLGRLLRISLERPFDPKPTQIVYQDQELQRQLLLHERTLSRESIADASHRLLGAILGRTAAPLLHAPEGRPGTALAAEQHHREETHPGQHDQDDGQGQRKIFEGEPVAHDRRVRQ
jgi:hypothetical protein